MPLFRRMLDILFPPRSAEALARAADADAVARLLCPRVIDADGAPIIALLPYRAPIVRALVHEAKFHGNAHAERLLGGALASYLDDFIADRDAYEGIDAVLVPVPLGASRRKERGYNQAERIARAAGAIPLETGLLVRARDTEAQTALGRKERLRNLEDAFAASAAPVPGRTYIVVDDVTTTGATLTAARAALLASGATEVIALALAH